MQDIEIESIGKGVDELHEIARAANEEVRMQGRMLETLEGKIDDVHDHVSNVNVKLKETLEKARGSDKICLVSDRHQILKNRLLVFASNRFVII